MYITVKERDAKVKLWILTNLVSQWENIKCAIKSGSGISIFVNI